MKPTTDIQHELVAVGGLADSRIDLAETALLLGSIDRPCVKLEPYRRHIKGLGRDVGHYLHGMPGTPDIAQKAEALVQVLHRRYGYIGAEECFHDPEAANLTRVIDRRSGLPVAIGILYLASAQVQGWTAVGLDFPGRFLIRLEDDTDRVILDPFSGGRTLTTRDLRDMLKAFSGNHAELRPRHYEGMARRKVLVRLQGNVRGRLLREERLDDAVQVVETMLLFAPREADLWRECGLLHSRLNNVAEAIAALEEYLQLGASPDVRYGASVLLQELRQRLN